MVFKKITYFLAPKWGVDLYMGSTYTQVNKVLVCIFCEHAQIRNVGLICNLSC